LQQSNALRAKDEDTGVSILDENGNITDQGRMAQYIKASEGVGAILGKGPLGKKGNVAKIVKGMRDAEYEAQKQIGEKQGLSGEKLEDFASKNADAAVEPFVGLSGGEFFRKQAELKAGSFMASNSMVLANGHIFSGAMGANGGVSGSIKGGMSSTVDKSSNYTDQKVTKEGEVKDIGAKQKASIQEYNASNLDGSFMGIPFGKDTELVLNEDGTINMEKTPKAAMEGYNEFMKTYDVSNEMKSGWFGGLTASVSNTLGIDSDLATMGVGAVLANQAGRVLPGGNKTLLSRVIGSDPEPVGKSNKQSNGDANKYSVNNQHNNPPSVSVNDGKYTINLDESGVVT